MTKDEVIARSYFRERTAEQQLKMKADYEHIISLAKGEICGPDSGKLKYMIPYWEEGLRILNEVINERSQQESRAPHAI